MNKERIFIVSDLHGLGSVYFGIINYLEKLQSIHFDEKIILYINGDLIDRGPNSIKMLLDVMERVNGKGNIEVHMMAGNHELLMYEAIMNRIDGKWPECGWLLPSNGGIGTMCDFVKLPLEKQEEIKLFLRNLPLCMKFPGYIIGKDGVVLAHACPPREMKNFDSYNFQLRDAYFDRKIADTVWKRKKDLNSGEMIGLDDNFSIIGHTSTNTKSGFKYNVKENYLNIDGGCAYYSKTGELRVPVVELDYVHDKVKILGFDADGACHYKKTFAENGEIVATKKRVDNKQVSKRKGKYTRKSKLEEVYEYLLSLFNTSYEEFVKFVSTNKRKLAALGLVLCTLVGANVISDESDDLSVSISDEFFDENGQGTLNIKLGEEIVPVLCNSEEISELIDEVSCYEGESLEVLANEYSTTVDTLVDLNGNLVECNDGVYYACSDEIVVPDSDSIEKKLIKSYK